MGKEDNAVAGLYLILGTFIASEIQTKVAATVGATMGNLIGAVVVVTIMNPGDVKELVLAITSPTEHGKAILLRHNDEYIPATKANLEYYKNNIQTIKSMIGCVVDGVKKVGEVSFDALGKAVIDDASRSTGTSSYSDYQKDSSNLFSAYDGMGYQTPENHGGHSMPDYSKCAVHNYGGHTDAYGTGSCMRDTYNASQNTVGNSDGGGGGGDNGGDSSGTCYLI